MNDEWFADFLDELELDKRDAKDIDSLCEKVREYWADYQYSRAEQDAYERELRALPR